MFDKNKPYGEVYGGAGRIKFRYEQNGKFYNAQGVEVDKDGKPVVTKPVESSKEKK